MSIGQQIVSAEQIAKSLGLPPPTQEQMAIIEAPLEPTLVVAGAGSGKTETMAARVVWLVANHLVRPNEVLGLTFTRKAAGELAHRLRGRLSQLTRHDMVAPGSEPVVATYHSYALRVMAEHGVRAGYEPEVTVIGEAASWQIADAVVRSYDGDMSAVDSPPSTVTAEVRGLAAELAEQLRDPNELAEWSAGLRQELESLPSGRSGRRTPSRVVKLLDKQRRLAQLLPLVAEYTARKRADDAADYGDQLSRAARLVRDHPEVGRVERARYRVVLLDEYQDTSFAQLTLLVSLFGGAHPVIAVGDPCQAIYGWRGASAGNLARFPRDFPLGDGRPASMVPLSTSWRNAPTVLAAANALSAPLRGEVIPELRPAPSRPDAGLVRLALCETVVDEAAWIADRLAARWHAAPIETGPESMAVLLRTRAQIKRYADALSRAGLPVEVIGIGGLLEVPEVADVVATIRVLCDPSASTALLRLLTGARWRIGPRDLAALATRARRLVEEAESDDGLVVVPSDQLGIVDALEDIGPTSAYSAEGRVRLRSLRDELRQLRGFLNRPLPELVAAVEETLGVGVEVTVRDALDPSASRTHLDEFSSVVASFAESAQLATATALLAYLDAALQHERGLPPGRVEVHRGAVQLLTVHAAKGLEWDVVAVPGMCEGSFPAAERTSGLWTKNSGVLPFELRGDRAELPSLRRTEVANLTDLSDALERLEADWAHHRFTEERRLAYVAVTRARSLLLCSGHWWSDGVKPRGPSAFLTEILDSVRHAGIAPDAWAQAPDADAANPLAAEANTVEWPADPLGERRETIAAGAELVAEAARAGPAAMSAAQEDESGKRWLEQSRLLLAEREELRKSGPVGVRLPNQLSVSQLVAVGRDPRAVAAQLQRPVPQPPAIYARRGTAFHSWLERRFGSDQLFDLAELPGSADEDAAPDADLAELQAAFERSEWAGKTPSRVEVSFSMALPTQQTDGAPATGIVLRGRMDAVFAMDDNSGASWEVVDWKTGRAPTGDAARAAAVQLAVYRLAWAELAGVDLAAVRAGFHYIRENRTVCPVDLLDREGLVELIAALPEN